MKNDILKLVGTLLPHPVFVLCPHCIHNQISANLSLLLITSSHRAHSQLSCHVVSKVCCLRIIHEVLIIKWVILKVEIVECTEGSGNACLNGKFVFGWLVKDLVASF